MPRKTPTAKKARQSLTLSPFPDENFLPKNLYSDCVVIGVDEVGAGCLAGPLVAAAFAYRMDQHWLKSEVPVRVIDSKMLSEKRRSEARAWLLANSEVEHEIVEITPARIDEVNIYHARMEALAEAVLTVLSRMEAQKYFVFIDGPIVPKNLLNASLKGATFTALSKADRKFFCVAAASILAKEYRDDLMGTLSKEHPDYSWEKNVGYPTPEHKAAIHEHGPTPWHRRSFSWG